MTIRGYSSMADVEAFDREDEAAGRAAYLNGEPLYAGVNSVWSKAWMAARAELQASNPPHPVIILSTGKPTRNIATRCSGPIAG